jgi:hypothetical protein
MKRLWKVINGRRIWELEPVGQFSAPWYTVELRGPRWEGGEALVCIVGFASADDAVAEAERRGPLPDEDETSKG